VTKVPQMDRQTADDKVLGRERAEWLVGQRDAFQAAINGAALQESLAILVSTAIGQEGERLRCAFYLADDAGGASPHHGHAADLCCVRGRFQDRSGRAGLRPGGVHRPAGHPPDVAAEPLWKPWLWLAEQYGFRAVWSFPIETSERKVVGTLALYFSEPRQASSRDHELANAMTQAAGIIISRHQEAAERAQAEAALRESEARLRSAAEVGRLGLWDWNLSTGEFHWSGESTFMESFAAAKAIHGFEDWVSRIHPADRDATLAALRQAADTGEEFSRDFRALDSEDAVRWFHSQGRFFHDDTGAPVRITGATVDITDRRNAEERQKVFIAELLHRTRNFANVVRSIADRTAEASVDLPEFRRRLRERLESLSRVQDLLSHLKEGDQVTFDELVLGELKAMGGDDARISISGPQGVKLRSGTVQVLAMALHELATNALKYGALGQTNGRLAVSWRLERMNAALRSWLHVDWRESGVIMPAADVERERKGQGRELIEYALPYQLGAKTAYRFNADGISCAISVPISSAMT